MFKILIWRRGTKRKLPFDDEGEEDREEETDENMEEGEETVEQLDGDCELDLISLIIFSLLAADSGLLGEEEQLVSFDLAFWCR
jgi:hypothetical protein